MTYCVAVNINEGLVFASDSRTNAGVDHVSVYSKMHSFVWQGIFLSQFGLDWTGNFHSGFNRVQCIDAMLLL